MTINTAGDIVSAQDYYAYGEVLRGYTYGDPNKRFLFTEKERDVESGYDYFGARYYDSDIARWTTIDPLWEKYHGWSPYNYTLNNPLLYLDPDGMEVVEHTGYRFNKDKTHTVTTYAQEKTENDDGSITTTHSKTETILDHNGVEISTIQTINKTTIDKNGKITTEKSQSSGSSDFHNSQVTRISKWVEKNGGSYAESKSNNQSYILSGIGTGIALFTGKYVGLALPGIVLLDETNKRIHPHLKNVTYLGSNKIKKETVK